MGSRLARLEAELTQTGALTPRVAKASKAEKTHQRPGESGNALDAPRTDDRSECGVKLTVRGTVHQSHYADRIGISYNNFSVECRALLTAWNLKVRERHEGRTPLVRRFLALVEADKLGPDGRCCCAKREN